MNKDNERFNKILKLGSELNTIHDFDILLEKILFSARGIVNADAGSIYIREGNQLAFSHAQNQTLQDKLPPGRKLPYITYKISINEKSIAGYVAYTGKILNIEDVHQICKDSPYCFNSKYDKISLYRTQSVLTVPMRTNIGEISGVLQIINAKDKKGNIIPFAKEDELFIIHFANTACMVLQRAQMTRALLIRMIQMAKLRDPKETGAHVNRVASYSVELYERWARKKNISVHEIERSRDILRMAAMLHDVGKVAISDLILKKTECFTCEEYEIMKAHTYLGARLFKDKQSEFDEVAAIVALNHHENWDGTGYPGYIDIDTGKPTKKIRLEKQSQKKAMKSLSLVELLLLLMYMMLSPQSEFIKKHGMKKQSL